jgi:hypothetical protein
MPVLSTNKPVRSPKPLLLVENQLDPGRYRFALVVVDDSQNASVPDEIIVVVRDRPVRPFPIDPAVVVRPEGVLRPDPVVPPGRIIRPPIDRPDDGGIVRPVRPFRPVR